MEVMEYVDYGYYASIEYGPVKVNNKLFEIAMKYKLKYSEDCIDVIYDYLLIYMKSVLRAMAEQKRKFRVVDCPEVAKSVKLPEMGKLWELDILWHRMSKEQFLMVQENDQTEEELNEKKRWEALKKHWFGTPEDTTKDSNKEDEEDEKMEEEAAEEDSVDRDEYDMEYFNVNYDLTADEDEDAHDEEEEDNEDEKERREEEWKMRDRINSDNILQTHVTGRVVSELAYYNRYTLKDLLQLLKMNPFIIPKKPIRHLLKMNAAKKAGLRRPL